MKSDVNGCSTCPIGAEQYEEYYSSLSQCMKIQYDYRHSNDILFSCVAATLEKARDKRNLWFRRHHGIELDS